MTTPAVSDAAMKACCAAAYGTDVVRLFLGESYHPGGLDLTRRLASMLGLGKGARVLDVAAGNGATAVLLATEFGASVVGIDLGASQVESARAAALGAGVADTVRFEVGDAEGLPFADGSFDVVVCECAFCTFPSKPVAAGEMARVLRPGGRVGLTDVWLDPSCLDEELSGLAGRVACLADARPIDAVVSILEGTGLRVDLVERHDDALASMILGVETRLRALRLVDLPALRGYDLRRGISLVRQAAAVVERRDAGYLLLVATKL